MFLMTLKNNKVRKTAKIRNRYNQVPHLTQGTTCESHKNTNKHQKEEPRVVMGVTLGTGTFKPEKNLVFFFRIKSLGPHRCHPGKLE